MKTQAFLRDERGASAIEFALVSLPFILTLLMILQMGIYYMTQSALDAGVIKEADSLVNTLYSDTNSNTVPAAPLITYATPSGATLRSNEITAGQTSIGTGNVGVIVTVTYQYSLMFFSRLKAPIFPNGATWPISYTVAQRKS